NGAIGTAQFWRLRQRDEERYLAERQAARLLAEVHERRGAHAFDVAAEGREIEIERKNLGLAQLALELQRTHHLAQFHREGTLTSRFEEACHLHRQRRGARDDAAIAHEL